MSRQHVIYDRFQNTLYPLSNYNDLFISEEASSLRLATRKNQVGGIFYFSFLAFTHFSC